MRMMDILPEDVRAWITKMQAQGTSAWTIQYGKYAILNSIFTTAMERDRVIVFHPSRGVRTPSVPSKPRQIITPDQFDAIYQALPTADDQLLVETLIESGLRWSELTELRVRDLSFATQILTVSWKVIEVDRKFGLDGKRFAVMPYPKDKEYRRLLHRYDPRVRFGEWCRCGWGDYPNSRPIVRFDGSNRLGWLLASGAECPSAPHDH
jgi:integrase